MLGALEYSPFDVAAPTMPKTMAKTGISQFTDPRKIGTGVIDIIPKINARIPSAFTV